MSSWARDRVMVSGRWGRGNSHMDRNWAEYYGRQVNSRAWGEFEDRYLLLGGRGWGGINPNIVTIQQAGEQEM